MIKPVRCFLFLLLIFSGFAHAQTKVNTDSLWNEYKNTANVPKVRFKALMSVAKAVRPNYPDSALKLLDTLDVMARQINDTVFIGQVNHIRGLTYKNTSQYRLALKHYLQALQYWGAIGYDTGMASVHQHLGNVYTRMQEKDKAVMHYNLAVEAYKKLNDEEQLAGVYNDMGNTYRTFHEDSLAMLLLRKSLEIRVRKGNKRGIATTQMNMAGVFAQTGEVDSAIFYMEIFQRYAQQNNNKPDIIRSLNNLGELFNLKGAFTRGKDSCMKALRLNSTINLLQDRGNSCECLYTSYKALNRPDSALKYFELLREVKDSLLKESTSDEIARLEIEYEYNQKAVADSLQAAQQFEVLNARSEGEKSLRYVLFAGLGLTVIFAGIMFNRFRVTRRQKNLIAEQHERTELQKQLIEEKNREITDSITYAQRLQNAILPSEKLWKQQFPDSFIFYRPKDIVAGDFYWLETENNRVLFAVADCTGHGVPGALVSVVCSNALNRAVHEFGLTDPGAILDKVTELVTFTFENSSQDVYDGMDISICSYNTAQRSLEWAGANLPLCIYRNGSNELEEIKPNKQPVGKFERRTPFTTHTVAVNAGDMLFLFSDGFADQFGGPKGKKFKYRSLQELLRSHAQETTTMQSEKLTSAFDEWRGLLEQVDDVCVIGICI